MEENLLGFVMWCAVGGFFLGMAVYGWFAKKPVGFWANTEMFEVTDVRKYNRELARLFCVFGVVMIGLGIPILVGDPAWIMLSVVGVMAETIAAMVVYCLVIEKKYRK